MRRRLSPPQGRRKARASANGSARSAAASAGKALKRLFAASPEGRSAAGRPRRRLALSLGSGVRRSRAPAAHARRRSRRAFRGAAGRQPARAVAATKDEAEAMRLLRRMKAEAALLIALADIGGVWPVMRTTRALTELADTAVGVGGRFPAARRGASAARFKPRRRCTAGARLSGYIVLAMGKMGAYELNYSSDIDLIVFYDPEAPALVPTTGEAAAFYVRHHARAGEASAGAHRRRLCVPRRSAAAARSGLDPDRGLDRRRRSTTTAASARTGSAPR